MHIFHAIDIAFAGGEQEAAHHQGRRQRLGVGGIGPEIHQQQAGLCSDRLADAVEQVHVPLWCVVMPHVGDQDGVMIRRNVVLKKVALDNPQVLRQWGGGQTAACNCRH